MKPDSTPLDYTIAAVARALRLLELFSADEPELDLITISRRAGLPKSTTFRYLNTLEALGYIEHGPSAYHLSLKLFQLGQVAVARLDVRAVARPKMIELARRYQENVSLGVLHGEHVVLIEVVNSSQSIRRGATLGDLDGLHSSAIGKAILAHQGPDAVDALTTNGVLPRLTPQTLTNPQALKTDLESTRQSGYSIDEEEGEVGLSCVGVPIFDHRGGVKYGLSLSAPSMRLPLPLAHQIGRELVEHSARISAELGALPELQATDELRNLGKGEPAIF